jgi:hypothetical protein
MTEGSLIVRFEHEKDTKNAVRFQEVLEAGRERGVVGNIYVLKSDLAMIGNPQKLVVTIDAG